MCQSIQFKRTSPLLIPLLLACFTLLPRAQAQTPAALPSPAPDGAYKGFNTAEGLNALFNVNTAVGQFNTALGFAALKFDTSGAHNTGVGAQALLHNTLGSYNTAVGENALVFNTSGSMNMALGQGALAGNFDGSFNNAMGFQALSANTANDNTAVGAGALATNSTGGENTAAGASALNSNIDGDGNNAFGDAALFTNNHGDFNNAFGHVALFVATGDFNTAFGDEAGRDLSSGSGNTFIGAGAGSTTTMVNGMVLIGLNVIGDNTSNHTFIRNINTTSVSGGGTDTVTVNLTTGLLGHLTSSRRYKEDIKPMDNASETIFALKPVTYRYKKDIDKSQAIDYGLVAEDVAKVDPNLAIRDGKGQIDSVRYNAVNAMLLNEFLKEHQTVKALKSTVEKQEATIAQQQKGMEVLTAQLKEQASQIQKVSAQLELNKTAPRTVDNK